MGMVLLERWNLSIWEWNTTSFKWLPRLALQYSIRSTQFFSAFSIVWAKGPNVIIEKPMHPQRVSVWFGFWYGGIIGAFFLENEQGAAVPINGKRYRAMLNEFLFPKIEEDYMDGIWFQQYGTTFHTAKVTINFLRTVFENQIISRNSETIEVLKYKIEGAIHGISPNN